MSDPTPRPGPGARPSTGPSAAATASAPTCSLNGSPWTNGDFRSSTGSVPDCARRARKAVSECPALALRLLP